jgi:glycine betaine/proline transport system substrate-binding protein
MITISLAHFESSVGKALHTKTLGAAVSAFVATMLLTAGTSLAEDGPGKGVTVVPCTSTSIEGLFHQLVPAMGLEKLGYTVKAPTTLAVPAMHQAIASGDCTYAVDHWVPLHDSFYKPIKDKVVRLGPAIEGATQGYLIDKKTADAHHITSLEQFKDPTIATLFDSDGNGKATLAGANPGWGAELVINHELDAIGLRGTVDHKQGEYSVLIADTVARYKQGKPVFFYTWTPNWTIAELKPGEATTWLTVDPKFCPENQGCEGGSTTGFGLNKIAILANKDFVDKNPAAKAFLDAVRIPIADINAENLLIRQGQDKEADVKKHAASWVAAHQADFDGWVKAGLAAAKH